MKPKLSQLSLFLVPIVLWLFPENRTVYVHSVTLLVLGLSVFSVAFESGKWKQAVPFTLFWSGTAAITWFLSERNEGREVASQTLPLLLTISAGGLLALLRISMETKKMLPIFLAMLLTWAVMFLSGKTGSADSMRNYFSLFGLSPETVHAIVVAFRKSVHVSFYGLLAYLFFLHWKKHEVAPLVPAFVYTLAVSVSDEWRQNLMPNRGGTISDVLLDMSAATFVLWRCHVASRRSTIP